MSLTQDEKADLHVCGDCPPGGQCRRCRRNEQEARRRRLEAQAEALFGPDDCGCAGGLFCDWHPLPRSRR